MKARYLVLTTLTALLFSASVQAQFKFDNYALEHVNIIDVNTGKVLKDYTIVISEDIILDIVPAKKYVSNDTVQSIPLNGQFVVPGLIDAHVHFATDATEERRYEAEKVLKEMLLTGVTSVRDMAGDARALSSLSRDALVGDIEAPNIYYSSLMAGPEFFADPRTIATSKGGVSGGMPYMKAIDRYSDLKLEVAQAIGTGASGIKLYAKLPSDLVQAIVKEAKLQGFPVWSHGALIPSKPSEVIASGVISISHVDMLLYEFYNTKSEYPENWTGQAALEASEDFWNTEYNKLAIDALLTSMKKNDVVLDATVSIYEAYKQNEKYRLRYEMAKRITREANKAGVKVAAGSDTDQVTFVQHEMKLLVNECDFTPFEAILAATKHAAQASGISNSEGSIEKDKKANLLILNSDPTLEIDNIDHVSLVVKFGKLYNPMDKE